MTAAFRIVGAAVYSGDVEVARVHGRAPRDAYERARFPEARTVWTLLSASGRGEEGLFATRADAERAARRIWNGGK